MDRTSDSRPIRMLTFVDESTRECLAIDVARKLTSEDVLERLSAPSVRRGVLTAVENGGAGTVSRRSKMAAHNRAGLCEGVIGATPPITPPFRERHRSALRHGDVERDTAVRWLV